MNLQKLSRQVHGQVLQSSDEGFNDACRLWNVRLDRRPDIVARCRNADDVRACVEFARQEGVTLSVKGGGHSYSANTVGADGLLVDLSLMKAVQVDPEARTAIVEAGVTCRELDQATQEYCLATPLPTVSSVGVAGATLGGGSGYLSRKYGLALDNLIEVELVTADGRLLRVNERTYPDLFWAVRGAGANFGIATSLKFRLHKVGPRVLAGQIIYPFDDAVGLLRFFREFMAAAPDEFQCYPFMFRIPPVESFPERFHGHPALDFVLCHLDDEAADFVRPLRQLGETILEDVKPLEYTVVQQCFDAGLPKGQRYYSKACYLDGISDDVIEIVAAHAARIQGAFSAAYFEVFGRAVTKLSSSATAFAGRNVHCGFHILAGWTDAAYDETVMTWARDFHEAVAPYSSDWVYVNLLGDDENDRVPAAYGANYRQLVELKGKWDPHNLFRMNYNIKPPAQS